MMERVRRTLWYLAAWAGATIVSGMLAWGVVGMAGARVSDPVIHTLSAAEVASLAEQTATTATTSTGATSTTGGAAREQQLSAEVGEVSVHRVHGGTVTLRLLEGDLQLVSVTPAQGFRTVVEDAGPDHISVDLIGDEEESEFEAELEDGRVVVSSQGEDD